MDFEERLDTVPVGGGVLTNVFTSPFWKSKKVLVTGGAGFLGQHLVRKLRLRGAEVAVPRRKDFELTHLEEANRCLQTFQPDTVIHLAASYGGLGVTLREPGRIYFENLLMGTYLLEAARIEETPQFVTIGTACSYPGHLAIPMTEDDFWSGPVHDSVAAYGFAKKMLAVQGIAYQRQYGLNSIHLVLGNLYGPHDCVDPHRSHVTGALIRRFLEAEENETDVHAWGTGEAIRDFLFVEDAAEGILLAAERYHSTVPLNIGTGRGVRIRELAQVIADTISFRGQIRWEPAHPDGQPVRILEVSRMVAALQWQPSTSLSAGIAKTIAWFRKQREKEGTRTPSRARSRASAGKPVSIPGENC